MFLWVTFRSLRASCRLVMSCRVPLSYLPFSLPRDEAHTQLSVSARLTGLQALGRARAAPPGSLSCDKHRVCSAQVGSVVFFFPPSLFAQFSVEVVMKFPLSYV